LFRNDDLTKRTEQTIYIAGGGGGIGHVAIQLAKLHGLHVITSASKPAGIVLAKSVGADTVIDYHTTPDFVAEVMKLTHNTGVDLALDPTYNTASFVQSASVVKAGGRWFRIGNHWNQAANDEEAREICAKRGVDAQNGDIRRYWEPRYYDRFGELTRALEEADKLYGAGKLRIHVSQTVPFELDALQQGVLDSGHGKHVGKVVIKFNGTDGQTALQV
jgi:NADPH:quinone reductase-like Zn-dependent oxidoreductase